MIFAFDDFELDAARLELRRSGALLKVDTLVLRLLSFLVQHAGTLVTKDELVEGVWDGRAVADNAITVSMARLRKALGDVRGERELVVTVYGRGYRFVRPVRTRVPSVLPPPPGPQLEDHGPPLVGRERVLERLRHALSEARAGRGRVCALLGEPGIGKTRVVEAFETELPASQTPCAWGYCREAGDTPPLSPWLRLLRTVVETSFGAELEAGLGALAPQVRTLLDTAPGKPFDAAGTDAIGPNASQRHRTFDCIMRVLALAATRTPWVLVLDDVHRADAASLELLRLLMDEIAHMRVLVVVTLRHAQGQRAPRPETDLPIVIGHRNCERVVLPRLSEDDVVSYVGAQLDDTERKLGRAVFAKSEGNPFFMVELSRQLRDASAPGVDALSLSGSALELVRQRVAPLGKETRELLSLAAAVGRSFELTLLATITGQEPAALMDRLDEALGAEVLMAAPGSVTAFAFGHELLRSALYDSLQPKERRALHLRIVDALEQRALAGDAIPASELAFHAHAALPEGDLRKTVQLCRAAAGAAAVVFANSDVVRYAHQAIEALELMEKPSVRLRMRLLHTISLYSRGHVSHEFERATRETVRLAEEQGDGEMLVRAGLLFNLDLGFQPMRGGARALERGLELLPPDHMLRAVALSSLACSGPYCFDRKRAEAALHTAIAQARKSGMYLGLYGVLLCQLYLEGGPEHAAEMVAVHDELEAIAQAHLARVPVLPANLALHRAHLALQRGDSAGVTSALDRAAVRLKEIGGGPLLWHTERKRALVAINAGAWLSASARLNALHRRAEQIDLMGTAPVIAFDRMVVFAEAADAAPLDDVVRTALEHDGSEPPSMWSAKVRALASAGLVDEARASLRAISPAELSRLPCDRYYLGTLASLARACVRLQANDYLEALHALLAPHADHYAAPATFLCEGAVPQVLGMLSLALGRQREAVPLLEQGIAMNDRAGFVPRAIEARITLARALLSTHAPRARTLAGEAKEQAARLGLQALEQEAARVLGS